MSNTDDIVERLRRSGIDEYPGGPDYVDPAHAADVIEQKDAEIERLRDLHDKGFCHNCDDMVSENEQLRADLALMSDLVDQVRRSMRRLVAEILAEETPVSAHWMQERGYR